LGWAAPRVATIIVEGETVGESMPFSHNTLYQDLRAHLIERRFVTFMQRRVYMFGGGALIEPSSNYVVSPQPETPAWKAMLPAQQAAALQAPLDRFRALPPDQQEAARWTNEETQEENPWLMFAPMAVALAVEQRLGHAHARAVLDGLLQSLAAMFRFGGRFSGYPVRWDPLFSPVSKRVWFNQETESRATEFLLTPAGDYGFANAPADFRAHPRRPKGRLALLMENGDPASVQAEFERMYFFKRHSRQWEPSQDEMFGIVTTLWAIAYLTTDAGLRSRATGLLGRLAGYLSGHGYLLVSPAGGLAPRGHGDSLVAAEFALNEAFESVLGHRFPAFRGTEGPWLEAMKAAGYANQLRGLLNAGAVVGSPLPWMVGLLATVPLAGSLLVNSRWPAIEAARLHPYFGVHLGKMLAVLLRSEVFDPWAEEFRVDTALSMYLHEHQDTRFRFELYCEFIHGSSTSVPVTGFMPFIGLPGLDRTETLLRDRYLAWFHDRRQQATARTPLFAMAVACLLAGDDRYEQELSDALDHAYVAQRTNHGDDLPLAVTALDSIGNQTGLTEDPLPAIDYMGAVALAWLHTQRRGSALVVPDLPRPPTQFSTWRRPQSRPDPATGQRTDLFPGDTAPPRATVPRPDIEPAPDTALPPQEDVQLNVAPNVREVDTHIDIRYGDIFQIDGSGSVRILGAPVASTGPQGTGEPAPLDPDWPVHAGLDPRASPFALTARLNGWFIVGAGTGPRRWFATHESTPAVATRRLYLRVNQPLPQLIGWGGAFQARVRVWRHDPGPSTIAFDQLAAYDFGWFPPRIDVSYRWANPPQTGIAPPRPRARMWIHVRQDGSPWAQVIGQALPVAGFMSGPIDGVWVDPLVSPRHVVAWNGATTAGSLGHRNGRFEFRVTLVVGNVPLTEIVACDIHWHGQRVQCVRRPGRTGPRGLQGIGGTFPQTNRRWYLSLPQAIEEIDRGQAFYVEEPTGDRVAVVVDRTSRARPFLHTVADGDGPNNLLSLPSCPP
jgi:hypothetical protein